MISLLCRIGFHDWHCEGIPDGAQHGLFPDYMALRYKCQRCDYEKIIVMEP